MRPSNLWRPWSAGKGSTTLFRDEPATGTAAKTDMNPREFFINPADYGLPTRDELVAYRIWDNHFHGFAAKNPIEQYEQNNFFVERMGIERSLAQEIGGTLEEPFAPY